MLVEYAVGKHFALILGEEQREAVSDLLIQFERLDGKERRQVEGGKKGAKHGKKGGRPAKKIARKERKRKA